jgi:WD40 repeat protein
LCRARPPPGASPFPRPRSSSSSPPGATATADGKPLDDPRAVTVGDLTRDEIRRVKVSVTFADGAADECLVDVAAGQRLRVAVPPPWPEKAAVVGTQPLVPVNSAAVSRDGRYIAVGLEDRAVVLWDTAAGRPVRTLACHQKPVLAVAFTPDGKHLLSGSADAAAVLWDVESGARLRTYTGHTGPVASVAFAPDGSRLPHRLARRDRDPLEHGKPASRVHTLKWKGILGVAYSPDGRHARHGVGGFHRDALGRQDRQAERRAPRPPGGRQLRRLQPRRPARRHRIVR